MEQEFSEFRESNKINTTSMHSSDRGCVYPRMHWAGGVCLGGVCPGGGGVWLGGVCPGGGDVCLGDVCPGGGGVCPQRCLSGVLWQTPPGPEADTHPL